MQTCQVAMSMRWTHMKLFTWRLQEVVGVLLVRAAGVRTPLGTNGVGTSVGGGGALRAGGWVHGGVGRDGYLAWTWTSCWSCGCRAWCRVPECCQRVTTWQISPGRRVGEGGTPSWKRVRAPSLGGWELLHTNTGTLLVWEHLRCQTDPSVHLRPGRAPVVSADLTPRGQCWMCLWEPESG